MPYMNERRLSVHAIDLTSIMPQRRSSYNGTYAVLGNEGILSISQLT